jgi:hypothetical protein
LQNSTSLFIRHVPDIMQGSGKPSPVKSIIKEIEILIKYKMLSNHHKRHLLQGASQKKSQGYFVLVSKNVTF